MTKKNYVIQECLDDNFKEYFVILREKANNEYVLVSPKHFDTLEEAKEAVRLMRKHRQPIYHYVED